MRAVIFFILILQILGCSDTPSETVKNISTKETSYLNNAQRDYYQALQRAKDENKSVFILVETQQCRWCKRLKSTTLQDENLSKRLQEEFVVLVLDRDQSRYPEKFAASGVPTVYMIDTKEEIYTQVVGYREDPKEYLKWFDYIAIERGIE